MAITRDSDLHTRRFSRNAGLGVVLLGFVAIVFGLTVVKVERGSTMEAYDHQPRTSLLPAEGAQK
ncbi:MAG: hypothetical protein H5U24_12385 [Thioclava marina]|jgi:hypothetical protein|uniref:Cytochrome C oxidase assembly protein n=1 Tax=Thioclava marina TaxID=1915077 RepID=A0ABX3MLS1_9RHOB|nr:MULTISPECIES: hypothetical protein [Thioclava]TNE93249.1 MAG: hypothetical protein EP337_03975 [Paracoccaceae bacterium]MBC7146187.1 hypothetical protein [Thioclava marina]MBD3804037.1 hypothetical protein [Thioclava sp.]OOY12143.1 hypothetical protein BMG00_13930 [Thioclava marina]OOY27668.1 hypothetical protein BMI90_10610 [Thioclava sp. L04-15]